jgi:shikimate dehydrogenase
VCNSPIQPVLALLGHPVAGNPTQYMVEKAFQHHELDWEYISLDVTADELGDALRGMRSLGFRGGNLIDPHKQTAIQYLNRISPTAEMIGAVNCILREERQLVGENTEGKAFLEALRRRTDPAHKQVVLLGAGRLARAIAVELSQAKAAAITVVSRSEAAGRHLVDLLTSRLGTSASLVVWEGDYGVAPETQVVVNATSLGTGDDQARVPVRIETLSPDMLVADATANPPQTWLIRQAAERGVKTIDGLEIFIAQTAINFRLWTGVDPDLTVLREAVEEFLEL